MKQAAKQFEVDGMSYTVDPFLTSKGIRLMTDIVKMIGPTLGKFVSGFDSKSDLDDLDTDTVAEAFITFSNGLHPDDFDRIIKRILENTLVDSMGSTSAAQVYDTYFQGRYKHLAVVVYKSLEVQYGDFFGVVGDLAKRFKIPTSTK